MQRDFALTYLLISHSLPVVAQLATRIAVMQGGRIVETGDAAQILGAPAHPYTKSLIAAIPVSALDLTIHCANCHSERSEESLLIFAKRRPTRDSSLRSE